MTKLLSMLCVVIAFACLTGCGHPGTKMTRSEYGDRWPLTVNEGVVSYDRGVLFTTNGVTYAVNGTALSNHQDLPKINEIWADDTRYPGMGIKKDIGVIIDKGLELDK